MTKHTLHPWHEVSRGAQAPKVVNAVIEIPQGSRAKYELDKATGLLRLDRILYSSVYYPANYGLIPQSYGDDNDPLDILVLSQANFEPLCLVQARVIGVMRMLDQDQADDKIIAVADKDVGMDHINNIRELPPHFTEELEHFFEQYKKLEQKTVVVEGFQERSTAISIIKKSFEDYDKKIRPTLK